MEDSYAKGSGGGSERRPEIASEPPVAPDTDGLVGEVAGADRSLLATLKRVVLAARRRSGHLLWGLKAGATAGEVLARAEVVDALVPAGWLSQGVGVG